jgi:DNA-binding response OmpR family regulator
VKILLVEDEADLGAAIKQTLNQEAYVAHIRHPQVLQREITERKNPREHKNKHMQ